MLILSSLSIASISPLGNQYLPKEVESQYLAVECWVNCEKLAATAFDFMQEDNISASSRNKHYRVCHWYTQIWSFCSEETFGGPVIRLCRCKSKQSCRSNNANASWKPCTAYFEIVLPAVIMLGLSQENRNSNWECFLFKQIHCELILSRVLKKYNSSLKWRGRNLGTIIMARNPSSTRKPF